MSVDVTVNGTVRTLGAEATVATVVDLVAGSRAGQGIAVARNGEVVPRGDWAATVLADGDDVEVLTAVQGG